MYFFSFCCMVCTGGSSFLSKVWLLEFIAMISSFGGIFITAAAFGNRPTQITSVYCMVIGQPIRRLSVPVN